MSERARRRNRPPRSRRHIRLSYARRIIRGWPYPLELARLYRVPYRLIMPGLINKPLIHKGRKP